MEPFIGFSVFIIFAIIMVYTGNKNLHSHQETVINSLGPHTILYIEQIKPNTFFMGTGIKAYSFRRCDLILTEDALVFLGREEDNLVFKNYTRPIILTSDYNKYKDFIPFCTFLEIFSIEIVDGNIKLKFGKKGLSGIDCRVILDCLTTDETNLIKEVAIKNNWKSPYYNTIHP
ncbi:MAG TPA: hypothetical protein VJL37_09235 [Flavobacterium sp.]|nr:hypothetical protein [Flavobacterium sp.]